MQWWESCNKGQVTASYWEKGICRMRIRKAGTLIAAFTAAGVIVAASVMVYLHRSRSVPALQPPSVPVQGEDQSTDQADANEASFSEPLPLGSRFGYNQPAPPPITFFVGRSPDEAGVPDLGTPAAAVQTILSLIDQGATDKLALCLLEETDDAVSDLYPRYLGQPVGLVEVVEDEESAKVVWETAVHTAFSRQGKRWTPGETILLTARVVQVEGRWRLVQLHEGDEDDTQRQDVSPN